MCQISEEMRQIIIATDAEGGKGPNGKVVTFGTLAFMKALGIPRGDAVNRIIIDVQHNAYVQVYICRGGMFPHGAEPIMELLSRLSPVLMHDSDPGTAEMATLETLRSLHTGDAEVAHSEADKVLLGFLREIGHRAVADAFEDARSRLGFYYA